LPSKAGDLADLGDSPDVPDLEGAVVTVPDSEFTRDTSSADPAVGPSPVSPDPVPTAVESPSPVGPTGDAAPGDRGPEDGRPEHGGTGDGPPARPMDDSNGWVVTNSGGHISEAEGREDLTRSEPSAEEGSTPGQPDDRPPVTEGVATGLDAGALPAAGGETNRLGSADGPPAVVEASGPGAGELQPEADGPAFPVALESQPVAAVTTESETGEAQPAPGGTTEPANPEPEPAVNVAADPVTTDAASPAPAESRERAPFRLPPRPEPDSVAASTGARMHPSARNRPLPRTLAVANQKGGVGKTTTAVNLGAALAELDYRVLVVDLDPQGNATTGLGINGRNLDASIYDVILHEVPIEDVIEPTTLKNLFVVPATIDLAGAEIELVPVFSRELRLKRALEPIAGDFDFVLIDCPPSLGLLTVNGLAAATEVAVPIQCEYYALEGLGQLLRNVGLVQTNLNGDLEVSTIILTMYDARTKLAEQVAEEVRQYFGDRVCRNVVPRTVRLSEAPSFGQPIIVFDPSSRGSIAYRELAKEVSGGAPKRTR
jgi:chromosome partitioning protein